MTFSRCDISTPITKSFLNNTRWNKIIVAAYGECVECYFNKHGNSYAITYPVDSDIEFENGLTFASNLEEIVQRINKYIKDGYLVEIVGNKAFCDALKKRNEGTLQARKVIKKTTKTHRR